MDMSREHYIKNSKSNTSCNDKDLEKLIMNE